MSLKVFFSLLLLTVLLGAFAVILPSFLFLQQQLAVIFPAELVLQAGNSLFLLLAWQAVITILVIGVLLVLLYVILDKVIGHKLTAVIKAMTAFAEEGERLPVPRPSRFTPKELRALLLSFDKIVDRVEVSHKKDAEVSRVKSDFISTAAHQLRTPLTGIRWALEALEKSDLSEEHKALVKSATDKSHELVSIVGTLLDISAIESGKYKYTFVPVDIEALSEEVAKDFSPMAQTAKVSVYLERATAPLPRARADRERIKWVLNNLIENAIRYTPAEGTVRIHIEVVNDNLLLKVRDSGIGIGDKDRDNIFERFYRAQNAIAVQNGGNGLGLYIARTIATDHGGDLTFAPNDDGIGTTFTFRLPIAQH